MNPPQGPGKTKPIRIWGAFATLLMAGLLAYALSPTGRVRMILGSHTLGLLERVDQAEPLMIDPNWVQNPHGRVIGQNHLAEMGVDFKGFVVIATGPPQGRDFARQVAQIVLAARTYQQRRKSCDFSPTVAYRLRAGDETLELLLDFQCDRLQLVTRDARGQATHTVFGDFDRDYAPLSALTKRAFPDRAAP